MAKNQKLWTLQKIEFLMKNEYLIPFLIIVSKSSYSQKYISLYITLIQSLKNFLTLIISLVEY